MGEAELGMTIQQQVGIPSTHAGHWNLPFDSEHHSIPYAVGVEGSDRLIQPIVRIENELQGVLRQIFAERLTAEERARANSILELLGDLAWHKMTVAIEICALLLPNLPQATGTMEETLQSAFAAAGMHSPADANAFLRASFENNLPAMIREVLPDFDPGELSIIKATKH